MSINLPHLTYRQCKFKKVHKYIDNFKYTKNNRTIKYRKIDQCACKK